MTKRNQPHKGVFDNLWKKLKDRNRNHVPLEHPKTILSWCNIIKENSQDKNDQSRLGTISTEYADIHRLWRSATDDRDDAIEFEAILHRQTVFYRSLSTLLIGLIFILIFWIAEKAHVEIPFRSSTIEHTQQIDPPATSPPLCCVYTQ